MPSWDWVQCIYCSCHCAQILLLGIIVIWSFHFKSAILKIYFICVSEAVENLRKCDIRACRWDKQVYKDCFNWTTTTLVLFFPFGSPSQLVCFLSAWVFLKSCYVLPLAPRNPIEEVVNLTNWCQFFMHLSCYWSWISS